MNILHIDSSIQGDESVSRRLSAAIVDRLVISSPDAKVVYRDLAASPLPQFNAEILAGLHSEDGHARPNLAPVCSSLDEVLRADVVVVGAPMYNLSVPTQLKSWLDAIAVPGKTFRYGPDGVAGLLGDKRVIIASTRGGLYGPDSPSVASEHQESYLRAFFAFLGVNRFEVVRAEGVALSPEVASRAIERAMEQASLLEAA
jgi:Acyl carrier protein phosphodiesterase